MHFISRHPRLFRMGLVVLPLLAAGAWLYAESAHARRQNWEGVIIETYRERRWWMGIEKPFKPTYRYHRHCWRIQTTDGAVIAFKVHWALWRQGRSGDPVRKVQGARWPELTTSVAIRQREDKDRALDILFHGAPAATE